MLADPGGDLGARSETERHEEAFEVTFSRALARFAFESSELAISALWALRRAGLRAPEDMSVVGVDDHEMAAVTDLTTVAQSAESQGGAAARLLVERISSGSPRSNVAPLILEGNLIIRNSTGPRTRR